MKKLSDIIEIVVDKTLDRGVAYLVNMQMNQNQEERPLLPCVHCWEPTAFTLCILCSTMLEISGTRAEVEIGYMIHRGDEVEVTTGWPVLEPVPVHNQ